jgi:hypothetical protein
MCKDRAGRKQDTYSNCPHENDRRIRNHNILFPMSKLLALISPFLCRGDETQLTVCISQERGALIDALHRVMSGHVGLREKTRGFAIEFPMSTLPASGHGPLLVKEKHGRFE